MKLNYRLMVTGLSSMTISLIVSIFLTFHVRQNTIVQFINNIFLNVFAGALILFVTSMVEYFVSKRRNFEEIMNYILKYRSYFSKIKYLNEIKYLTYDEYKTNFKKNGKSNEGFIKLIKEYDEYIQNQFKDIDEIIDAYLDIANINLNDFLAIYDDLRFVINNAYKKSKLNNEIFKKISDEVNNIRRLSYIIKTYINKYYKLFFII